MARTEVRDKVKEEEPAETIVKKDPEETENSAITSDKNQPQE